MAGRGRGRGRGTLLTQTNEKKPGMSSRDPLDQLSFMVKSLSLDADRAQLAAVTDLATKLTKEKQKAEQVTNIMYQRTQEDWKQSTSCVLICCDLTKLPEEGNHFRKSLLTTIRPHYDARIELRQSFPEKFLGNCAFLCQVFSCARDVKDQPYKILAVPVLEMLNLCFDENATEAEMNCAATQLFSTGILLHELGDKSVYMKLKNSVRDKVLDSIGSRELRMLLIAVMEGFASDWKIAKFP